jgi:hypothetical protein
MRVSLLLPILFFVTGSSLFAETWADGSAFSALKLIPHGEDKRVARIEAREGTPAPERWYILVNDPKDENGLHEYVVSAGEVVASRNVSQFAEVLKTGDVFGGEPLRIDSDRVANIAREYAAANKVTINSMNYELKKDGTGAALLWNVTCLDEAGKEIGRVYVTANKGTVVSHDGFTAEPSGIVTEKLKTPSEISARARAEAKKPQPRVAKAVAVGATPEPAKKPDFLQRVGGSLQHIFGGGNH